MDNPQETARALEIVLSRVKMDRATASIMRQHLAIERRLADDQPAADPDDDALDGVLFRFWIRAASYPEGWPSDLARVMGEEIRRERHASPAAYRRALMRLADEKGVNLPILIGGGV